MKNLLNFEGPIFIFLSRVADLIILSVLWVLCCIPVITIGPATTALYYVTMKMVKHEDDGIVKSFFRSFKLNFRQGALLTLIFLVAYAILYLNYQIVASTQGTFGTVLFVIFLLFAICVLGATIYSFPLLAKFDNTIGRTLKNAILLSIQHLFSTILLLLLNCLPIIILLISTKFISSFLPILVFLIPGGISFLCSLQITKIFDTLVPVD